MTSATILLLYLTINLPSVMMHANPRCMFIDYIGLSQNELEKRILEKQCSQIEVCKKNFKISIVDVPPYSTETIFEDIIRQCCGNCTNITHFQQFSNISEISINTINSSHFVLPILGKSSSEHLYGMRFLPLIDVPDVFLFTAKTETHIENLFNDYLNILPLIFLILLMAVISGFIIWNLETWRNEADFPRSFVRGVFSGFWWSTISMTTVGYGDLRVKTIPAKIYAIFWIFIGILSFGFIVSIQTAEIMKLIGPHVPSMEGARLGALRYRNYEASLIVKGGGVLTYSRDPSWHIYSEIFLLINMLRKNEIDGFVIDKYTIPFLQQYFEWKKYNVDYLLTKSGTVGETYAERQDDIEFFMNRTYRTLIQYNGEKLSYGVLVQDQDDFDYFHSAVTDNRLSFEIQVGTRLNMCLPGVEDTGLLSFLSFSNFIETVKVIGGVFCFMLIYGSIFEFYRYRQSKIKKLGTEETFPIHKKDLEV